MSALTREQVLQRIAGFGPLENVFLITGDDDTHGLPMVWYPEIGLRYVIIEKDDLAKAVHDYLRQAGVRRFKSESEVSEALETEKWEGWDTCADYRRIKAVMEDLATKDRYGRKIAPEVDSRNAAELK
jgi:hypothetical protein